MTGTARGAEPIDPHGKEPVNEAAQAEAVRAMFNGIAHRYDTLNHVLSINIDRLWWRRAARQFRHILARPEAQVLDVCCGTGDMTLALLRWRPENGEPVMALDFARRMLDRADKKFASPALGARRSDYRPEIMDRPGERQPRHVVRGCALRPRSAGLPAHFDLRHGL